MAASKTAGEILEAVVEDGQAELDRASAGLALSGMAAGLNVSFGAIAFGVVASLAGGIGLAAMLFYPVGFLIVILGRAQLFTENTVTPVTVVLTKLSSLPNMLRMWVVVFVSNVLGTVILAAALVYGDALSPSALGILVDEAVRKVDHGFWVAAVKGVFGGWVVALIAWLVAASKDTITQALFIFVLAFLIPAVDLTHCIAGSSEVLVGVFTGEVSPSGYLGLFLLPVTLGNIVGGVFLVTLLNYGQVAGSKPGAKTSLSGYTSEGGQREDT
ncbi:MAG: formate/nitrite transporter family protein [Actinomycetota bacterium]|nr:formate/nitrite transporter family protein [Actinomycetota bacterium]